MNAIGTRLVSRDNRQSIEEFLLTEYSFAAGSPNNAIVISRATRTSDVATKRFCFDSFSAKPGEEWQASERSAQRYIDTSLMSDNVVIQPYISEIERNGILSVICFEGIPSYAVRRLPAASDYR